MILVDQDEKPIRAPHLPAQNQRCTGRAYVPSAVGEPEDQWYAIDLRAKQKLRIDMTNLPEGADYDIFLFDSAVVGRNSSQAKYLTKSNFLRNNDETITYSSLTDATYYVRIYLAVKTNRAPNSYVLKITVT